MGFSCRLMNMIRREEEIVGSRVRTSLRRESAIFLITSILALIAFQDQSLRAHFDYTVSKRRKRADGDRVVLLDRARWPLVWQSRCCVAAAGLQNLKRFIMSSIGSWF